MLGSVMRAECVLQAGEVSDRVAAGILATSGRPDRPVRLDDFWFSASDAHNLCPRLFAIAVAGKISVRGAVGPDSLWNMALGTGFHHALQNEMLPLLGDVMQGGWRRVSAGGDLVEIVRGKTVGPWTEEGRGWGPRPPGDYWEFVEPKGRVPKVRLVGKWDGVLVWPDAPSEVLEIKSIREDLFASVNPRMGGKPQAKHILQVQAYMWMSGLTRARLVYVAKGSGELRAVMAEHVVARDDEQIMGLEAMLGRCWDAVQAAQETPAPPLPDRCEGCRIKSDTRARKCEMRDRCFPAKVKAA